MKRALLSEKSRPVKPLTLTLSPRERGQRDAGHPAAPPLPRGEDRGEGLRSCRNSCGRNFMLKLTIPSFPASLPLRKRGPGQTLRKAGGRAPSLPPLCRRGKGRAGWKDGAIQHSASHTMRGLPCSGFLPSSQMHRHYRHSGPGWGAGPVKGGAVYCAKEGNGNLAVAGAIDL